MQERQVKLFWPAVPSREDVIDSIGKILWPSDSSRPFIGEGALVDKFEYECAKKWDFDYVLFTNSGTAGLDLSLLGSKVNAGNEVITTPLTCTATNLPILMRQAIPVFTDVQYDTANIDPKDIEKKITNKTKAIMVVHWAGYPCDMDEIESIANKYKIPIIADGAHALGAKYKQKPISDFSDYTMFSLQSIKQMTTVDGGLLAIRFKNSRRDLVELSKEQGNRLILRTVFGKKVREYFDSNINAYSVPEGYFIKEIFDELRNYHSNQEFIKPLTEDYKDFSIFWNEWQHAETVRRSRWFGIGRDERIPDPDKGYSAYPTFYVGTKYHANNLDAIIGLESLKFIDKWAKRRAEIVERYNQELQDVSGVKLFRRDNNVESGNWLYNIHVERRDRFVNVMAYKGIETSIVHERNDLLPIFRPYANKNIPNLDILNNDRICIPLHQEMNDEDVDYVIYSIKQGW